MKKPQIFLSYSWTNKKNADKIYFDLTSVGFNVFKDDHNLKYTDKISDFMNKIRSCDYALLLINESYLQSINCMSEFIQLSQDEKVWEKILPVVDKDLKIYSAIERLNYLSYWNEKSAAIESALKNIDPSIAESLYAELNNHKEITRNIDALLHSLKDRITITPEDLFKSHYRAIFDKMGVDPDYSKLAKLLILSQIKDPKVRLSRVLNYIKVSKLENAACYSILAGCYRGLNKTKEAIELYKKALKLDHTDFAAWNNLGQIYQHSSKNFEAARECYEKAIEAMPEYDIPRINMGTLLSEHYKDFDGAKAQYEAILKFDENNAKAHNNLANIFRTPGYEDLDKAEKHLLVAVNQNNLEATMNYANFLKVHKKDFERGNYFYQRAKELDTQHFFTEIIDILMKGNKG